MKTKMIAGALVALLSIDVAAARAPSDRERARERAANLCYDDVQKLCANAIPDEAKIQACMRTHRGQLSAACRKAFDAGAR